MYSHKRQLGNLAEDLSCRFLKKQGFTVLDRNYLKKFGEIDIVAEREGILHFIEVKSKFSCESVTREIDERSSFYDKIVSRLFSRKRFTNSMFKITLSRERGDVSHDFNPEENVHYHKQRRFSKTIESYLLEKDIHDNKELQIDIIALDIDLFQKIAIINHIENVILD